jgi:hypothetical protein
LLAALESPRTEFSPASLGITPKWLAANVDLAIQQDLPKHDRPHSKEQLRLFRTTFLDGDKAEALVRSFGYGTDDFPSFVLEAEDSDGSRTIVNSDDQSVCMLPWRIDYRGKTYVAYDRSISDVIVALFPKGFPNRDRVGGAYLRAKFSEAVLANIRKEWNLLGSQFQIGEAFQEVARRFEVVESSLVSRASVDVGTAEHGASYGWSAELRDARADYPLSIGLFLPIAKGQKPAPDVFLGGIDRFVLLVGSVPWLREYVKSHPDAKVELRFVADRSFSVMAAASLVNDLKEHGRESLATIVAREAPESAFLEVQDEHRQWSRWVILPDRRAVLWHFKGPGALLFSADQFRTWNYSGWTSVGALVSPDGALIGSP